MPILGSGIMPPAGATANQLTAVTHRAFIPILVDQQTKPSPLMAMMIANNQTAAGGASQVTLPAQFGDMVQTQSTDYSGTFQLPTDIPTIQNPEWNLKATITPIPMFGMEAAIQDDYEVVNIMDARMNSAGNNIATYNTTSLYQNVTNTQQMIGLRGAIDDGTNLVTYAGINRTTYPSWQAYVRAAAANTNPTRVAIMQYIMGVAKNGGEMPNCVFCGFGTWMSLATDFIGQESYQITPGSSFENTENGPQSGFRAVMVAGVPVFADQFCTEGELWIINSNYLNLYIHEKLAFALTPFESMFANGQLGYIGGVVNLMELVCAKPSTQGHITGLGYTVL